MLAYAIPDTPLNDLDILLKCQFLKALPKEVAKQLESQSHAITMDQLVCKARQKVLTGKEELPIRAVSTTDKEPTPLYEQVQ